MRSERTSRNCSAKCRAHVRWLTVVPYRRIGLVLVACAVLPGNAQAQTATTSSHAPLVEQPEPAFPRSESRRGRDAFDDAALNAVQNWRFESAEEHNSNVLLNFVYKKKRIHLSREFLARNAKVHTSIDNGELDDAQERIDAIRSDEDLNAFELAYSYITEGRIADARGDQVGQLRSFRRAMLNHGRWLKLSKYHSLLYATVVLGIKQHDFASALRDYELLTETRSGRKVAAQLEEPMNTVRALVEGDSTIAPPYIVANMEMTIEHRGRIHYEDDNFRRGYTGDPEPERSGTQ